MLWSYGVTTVPERLDTTLPITLRSLVAAEFSFPRLFVDGEGRNFERFGLPITRRSPKILRQGNWLLGLLELYCREPNADAYALFQDDVIAYRGLKSYLERLGFPKMSYCNLFTFLENEGRVADKPPGWYLSSQKGRGAIALVFPRDAMLSLLSSEKTFRRLAGSLNKQSIDGTVATALKGAGYSEYVHSPTLVQHLDSPSLLGHTYGGSSSFRGEEFIATELIP